MGELFLYMKPKKNSPDNVLVFDLFKFFPDQDDEKIYVSKFVSPSFIYAMEEILGDKWKFIYYDEDISTCPVCGARLNHNGTQKFLLNKEFLIYKQTFSCSNKKCNFTKITHPEGFIDKNSNYTKEIKENAVKYSFISYSSYQTKAEYLNLHFGTKISRQSIYNYQNDNIEQYLKEEEKKLFEEIKKLKIKPSGIYCYDEEFIHINGVVYVRMTLVDYKTKIIINDRIIPKNEFNQKILKKFFEKSLKG